MRSMSACAPVHTLKPGWRALRFIGSAERKLLKPECISPQMERQRARAVRSFGSRPARGLTSLRYCIPDPDPVMEKTRNQDRWREQQELSAARRVVDRHYFLDEVQARHLTRQPPTQGPGGIILAADRQ